LIKDESDHDALDLPDEVDLTPYVAAYPIAGRWRGESWAPGWRVSDAETP
jgi:hypothetical protein